jgi:thymidine kinase
MEDIIKAIRNDPQIGTGSCSVIDECFSDEELVEFINEFHPDENDVDVIIEALRDHDDRVLAHERELFSWIS